MAATIDLDTDTLVPIATLVERRLKRRISPPTLWRWRMKGVRGVRLEAIYVAGVWHSTEEALTTFLRDSTAAAMPPADLPTERDAAKSRRLQEAGLI